MERKRRRKNRTERIIKNDNKVGRKVKVTDEEREIRKRGKVVCVWISDGAELFSSLTVSQ